MQQPTQQFIWVTFQKEGIHRYPAAGIDPRLKTGGDDDVSFLGYEHRHMFHFNVKIEVFHDDRDIEFIQFKRELEGLYNKEMLVLDHKSCEMIGQDLANYIHGKYPKRDLYITVAEDNENGALMFWAKPKALNDIFSQ